jgi:hypothetical protein
MSSLMRLRFAFLEITGSSRKNQKPARPASNQVSGKLHINTVNQLWA